MAFGGGYYGSAACRRGHPAGSTYREQVSLAGDFVLPSLFLASTPIMRLDALEQPEPYDELCHRDDVWLDQHGVVTALALSPIEEQGQAPVVTLISHRPAPFW